MIDFRPAAFFDLDGFAHPELLAPGEPVWNALGKRLVEYLENRDEWKIEVDLHPGVHLLGDRIAIAPGCEIEPGAVIIGPAVLDPGVKVRTGAYIRQNVVLASSSQLRKCTGTRQRNQRRCSAQ